MTGSPTAAERTAIRTAYAALHASRSPNSEVVEQIVFALGSAGLLMEPEAAAEQERVLTSAGPEIARLNERIVELEAIVANARKLISGWGQSHAEHLQVSLVPTLKTDPFMAGQQMGRSNQYSDCAEELADVLLGEDPDDWSHGVAVEVAAAEAGERS